MNTYVKVATLKYVHLKWRGWFRAAIFHAYVGKASILGTPHKLMQSNQDPLSPIPSPQGQ
jgi:hypothetical protein